MTFFRAFVAVVAAFILLACAPRIAKAHGIKTAYLEIVETAPGQAAITWKTPTSSREAMPVFPSMCTSLFSDEGDLTATRSQSTMHMRLACPTSLAGEEFRVNGLGLTISNVVVRVLLADGASHSQILSVDEPSFVVPTRAGNGVFVRFVLLGGRHVLGGADHLLFVLGLVFLARRPRQIVITATAFTVAHSITLALAALGYMHVSSAPAEACIALSLVLVALDIGRVSYAKAPLGIAFGFGLVHGLGFAGALTEIGLPKDAIFGALLAFNVGVELGQLAFIAGCLGVAALVFRIWPRRRETLAKNVPTWAAYAVGGAGAYLALLRIESIFRAL